MLFFNLPSPYYLKDIYTSFSLTSPKPDTSPQTKSINEFIYKYLHLPSIFPIKCVGGQIVLMRAWLLRYANQHSAIYMYIVLLSAYEVVVVNC